MMLTRYEIRIEIVEIRMDRKGDLMTGCTCINHHKPSQKRSMSTHAETKQQQKKQRYKEN